VEETGEGAVWVSVLWHRTSDIGLWILLNVSIGLNLSPVVVEETGESRIWMCVLGHWTSNIWLRILFDTGLNLCPVVVEEAGESRVGMSILRHRSPDIWLRIFIKLDSLNVNKTEKDSHGKRSGLFLLFHI
jgi:hypothetical protein